MAEERSNRGSEEARRRMLRLSPHNNDGNLSPPQELHLVEEAIEETIQEATTSKTTKKIYKIVDDQKIMTDVDEVPSMLPATEPIEARPLQTAMPVEMMIQRKRRRGIWSEDEHRLFLLGLGEYGRGEWTTISEYVKTRTPSQVASHAQKYFLRGTLTPKRKINKGILDIQQKDLLSIPLEDRRENMVLQDSYETPQNDFHSTPLEDTTENVVFQDSYETQQKDLHSTPLEDTRENVVFQDSYETQQQDHHSTPLEEDRRENEVLQDSIETQQHGFIQFL